jgi:hypothetical protein
MISNPFLHVKIYRLRDVRPAATLSWLTVPTGFLALGGMLFEDSFRWLAEAAVARKDQIEKIVSRAVFKPTWMFQCRCGFCAFP